MDNSERFFWHYNVEWIVWGIVSLEMGKPVESLGDGKSNVDLSQGNTSMNSEEQKTDVKEK